MNCRIGRRSVEFFLSGAKDGTPLTVVTDRFLEHGAARSENAPPGWPVRPPAALGGRDAQAGVLSVYRADQRLKDFDWSSFNPDEPAGSYEREYRILCNLRRTSEYIRDLNPKLQLDASDGPILTGAVASNLHIDLEICSAGLALEYMRKHVEGAPVAAELRGYDDLISEARDFYRPKPADYPKRKRFLGWSREPELPRARSCHVESFWREAATSLREIRKGEEGGWKSELRGTISDLQYYDLSPRDAVKALRAFAGLGSWDHPALQLNELTLPIRIRAAELRADALKEIVSALA